MSYYIGVDWGLRKVGVAFGDDESRIAFAASLIENDEHVFERLHAIAREYDACTYVVGMSEHMTQKDNRLAIEAFAKKLTEETGLSVVYVEEMMSTKEAHTNLKQAGKKRIGQHDDVEAARIILQHYFDHMSV